MQPGNLPNDNRFYALHQKKHLGISKSHDVRLSPILCYLFYRYENLACRSPLILHRRLILSLWLMTRSALGAICFRCMCQPLQIDFYQATFPAHILVLSNIGDIGRDQLDSLY